MRYYTKTDEWVLIKDGKALVGLSKFAADELGDIVYVDLPNVGDSFKKEEAFGAIESVKAASDLYMPIGGKIVEVNEALDDGPEVLNEDPLNTAIITISDFDEAELEDLIKEADYKKGK